MFSGSLFARYKMLIIYLLKSDLKLFNQFIFYGTFIVDVDKSKNPKHSIIKLIKALLTKLYVLFFCGFVSFAYCLSIICNYNKC